MTDSRSESEDEDVSGIESQSGTSLDDDAYADLEFLIKIGAEIGTQVPHVWNHIGAIWTNATDVLMGDDPEMSDEDESNPGSEEDPYYKPVYTVRDIVKWGAVWVKNDNVAEESAKGPILSKIYEWLSTTESVRDSAELSELEGIPMITEEPATIYNLSFQDLPPEIVAEILWLALKADPHIVIAISHVNAAFRSLVLSTPRLWTEIDIMFPQERIRAHLERSGSSLLRVRASLSLLTMPGPSGMLKLSSFDSMIKPHAARIASLEMRYTNAMCGIVAVRYLERLGPLPSLEKFDYGLLLHHYAPLNAGSEAACKPRRIRVEGVGIKAFRSLYSERVVSLQVTECWERGVSDWREALQSMPSLQKLELSDFKVGDPGPGENAGFGTTIPPISLPHLQILSLARVPRAVLIGLLQALQTPNLVSVTIAFLEPDGLRNYNPTIPWLKPQPTNGMCDTALLPFASANPQLQELDLHNCCMTPNMWAAVFAQLNTLNKLRISSSDVTTEALKSLVASSGSPPALPGLTHLTLDNESLDDESDLFFSVIDALITTRWTMSHQQEAGGETNGTQIQAMKSVVLRGWNESHIPTMDETIGFARLRGLVEHLHLETLQATSEDGEATDGEWESLSELSWVSGDQAVVDLGDGFQGVEWGNLQRG